MKIEKMNPPRRFGVPSGEIHHCANITLNADEQITFTTTSGKEYDVVKKPWGFFATASINGRLKKFGFRTALISDSTGKLFVCLVESDKEDDFTRYLEQDHARILCWLSETTEISKKT